MLDTLAEERSGDRVAPTFERLLRDWPDGRVKLLVTAHLLGLRRRHPELLRDGEYLPLETCGPHADRIVALARVRGDACLVVVAPRLVAPLLPEDAGLRIPAAAWRDTAVRFPPCAQARDWRDLWTGAARRLPADERGPLLPVAELLNPLPVAALVVGVANSDGVVGDIAAS
jgi:(1->4)-alpha-D-glucan 1-alpha-D-glucosylmutase